MSVSVSACVYVRVQALGVAACGRGTTTPWARSTHGDCARWCQWCRCGQCGQCGRCGRRATWLGSVSNESRAQRCSRCQLIVQARIDVRRVVADWAIVRARRAQTAQLPPAPPREDEATKRRSDEAREAGSWELGETYGEECAAAWCCRRHEAASGEGRATSLSDQSRRGRTLRESAQYAS